MHRRSFLLGLGSLIAAPAVVQAASLMPVRGVIMPAAPLFAFNGDPDTGFAGFPLTVYVDGARLGTVAEFADGMTPETAFPTLDEAIKHVDAFMGNNPGAAATIQMADGDYSMSRPFRATNGQVLAVHGRGPTTRVVSAASPHGAIAVERSIIELRDFDIAWHSRQNVILTTGRGTVVDTQNFAWPVRLF